MYPDFYKRKKKKHIKSLIIICICLSVSSLFFISGRFYEKKNPGTDTEETSGIIEKVEEVHEKETVSEGPLQIVYNYSFLL